MSKGERTRKDIIDKAFVLAGDIGLEGLSLGVLASETGLSKSGLFAHFKSKEALQLDVIDEVEARFTHRHPPCPRRSRAASPACAPSSSAISTGSPIAGRTAAASICRCAMNMTTAPVRCATSWWPASSNSPIRWPGMVQTAKHEGHFRADLDPEPSPSNSSASRWPISTSTKFLQLPQAMDYARAAFDGLLERSRTPITP